MKLDISRQRAVFVGTTGSGKSVLATHLISALTKPVVVADPKGDFHWPQAPNAVVVSDVQKLSGLTHPRIIYRPNAMQNLNNDAWEAFFKWIYDRQNTAVYVDEVTGILMGTSWKGPKWYSACLTRGRSRNVEVISGTQRPAHIPPYVLSESGLYFIFHLREPRDRERVAALTEQPELKVSPQTAFRARIDHYPAELRNRYLKSVDYLHCFWRYRSGDEHAALMRGIKIYRPEVQAEPLKRN